MNIFLQAFLWNDEPAYRYFLVLGLHLISFGCFHFVKAPGNKFEQTITFFLTKRDNHEQPMIGNLANARILIGAILSVANLIFTVLEMHTLVRKLFKSQNFTDYLQFSSVCYYDHSLYCLNKWVTHWEYVASFGLRTAGLIISTCLALPWPLLLLCLTMTNRSNKTLPCKETLRNRKLTDML